MKRIIGVCACPAGIAHTYMAAENLERQGKKLGFQVKIETNGSGGVENRLRDHCGRYPCGNGALQREKASGGFCNRCR